MAKRALTKSTDDKPILFEFPEASYRLTATGLEISGEPTYDHHCGVGDFVKRAYARSGWWLADWLRYGDTRKDWAENLSQAEIVTGVSEKRLKNIRAIGAIEPSRRRDGVEFYLHEEVAGLAGEQQTYWLEKAETEGWTRAELRLEMRAASRRTVIEGQAVLEGMFRVIVADPPWSYGDSGVISGSAYGRAESSFGTMSSADICGLPVAAHAMPNAVLFLWVPAPLIFEALPVIAAWGFTYKAGLVWDKVTGLPSHYGHQVTHEHLLICARGDGKPDQPTPHDGSIFRERRQDDREHSSKPNVYLRQWIEKHWTMGPYLELFGRERVDGWTVFGNDARLWAQEATPVAV